MTGASAARSLEDAVFKSLLKRPALRSARLQGGGGPLEPLGPEVARPRIRAALRAARDTDQALKNTTISDERGVLTDLVLRIGIRLRR